jgi:ribosomal protein L12E/L44/L45/RPP1/RPP2
MLYQYLLDAAGVDKKTVIITKMVKTVNEKAIKQIIKDNIIPQEAIDKLHSCDYTFRSKFCEIQ